MLIASGFYFAVIGFKKMVIIKVNLMFFIQVGITLDKTYAD